MNEVKEKRKVRQRAWFGANMAPNKATALETGYILPSAHRGPLFAPKKFPKVAPILSKKAGEAHFFGATVS